MGTLLEPFWNFMWFLEGSIKFAHGRWIDKLQLTTYSPLELRDLPLDVDVPNLVKVWVYWTHKWRVFSGLGSSLVLGGFDGCGSSCEGEFILMCNARSVVKPLVLRIVPSCIRIWRWIMLFVKR